MRVATAHYAASVSAAGQLVEIKAGSIPLELKSIEISQTGTTPDDQLEFELRRTTAVGTGTAIAPAPHEAGDAAPSWNLVHSWTTAPTEDANDNAKLLHFAFPSRSGYVWDTTPESVIIVPANGSVVLKLLNTPSQAVGVVVRVLAKEVG